MKMEEETSDKQQRDKDKVPVVNAAAVAAAAVQHHRQRCKNAPKVATGCKKGLNYLDNRKKEKRVFIPGSKRRSWFETHHVVPAGLSAAAATSRCTRWW